MKHKVTCMDCGKKDIIEIEKGKRIHSKKWYYFGKLNINACTTSKFVYKILDWKSMKFKKIKNDCYNPKAKSKKVELWVCDECEKKSEKEG